MEPILALTTAITSIKTATEIAQLLKTTDNSFEKAELRLKIADMMNALADTKISIAELKDIIQEKDEQIKTLTELNREQLNSEKLEYRDGLYFSNDGDGPFCTACYDTKKMKVRVNQMPKNFRDFGKYRCPNCSSKFV